MDFKSLVGLFHKLNIRKRQAPIITTPSSCGNFVEAIIVINYSRLMMPLALSRGILLRPRSERVETQLSLFVSMEAYGSVYVLTNCSTASGEYLTIFAV